MSKFDDYIKQKISEEETDIPESAKNKIEAALSALPEISEITKEEYKNNTNHNKNRRGDSKPMKISNYFKHYRKNITAAAAGIVFMFMFLLPNVSEAYAQAAEKIPVIGSIVRVVTIRNYFYQDDTHELNADVPMIEGDAEGANEAESAFSEINNDTQKLTEELVNKFYQDMENDGKNAHDALYVDYEVITDTAEWFTLKLTVSEVKGSSDTYYKFYNVNRTTGNIVKLGDIVKDEAFYETVEADIKRQMEEIMAKDSSQSYWPDGDSLGEGGVKLTSEHNFYWDKVGNLVIPFDKYEVAPGYMGTSEFTVERELIKDMVN